MGGAKFLPGCPEVGQLHLMEPFPSGGSTFPSSRSAARWAALIRHMRSAPTQKGIEQTLMSSKDCSGAVILPAIAAGTMIPNIISNPATRSRFSRYIDFIRTSVGVKEVDRNIYYFIIFDMRIQGANSTLHSYFTKIIKGQGKVFPPEVE